MQKIKIFNSNNLFIATLVCLFCLVVILSYSNYPSLDDFGFKYVFDKLGFWNYQKYYYNQWTGRFAGVFTTSLIHPLFYNSYLLYKVYPALNFILYYFSIYLLLKQIFAQRSRVQLHGLTAAIFLTTFASIPSVVDAFYWYPSTGYTWALSMNFFLIYFLIKLNKNKSAILFIKCLLLTVYCSGALEFNFLLTGLVLLLFQLNTYLQSKSIDWRYMALQIIAGIGSLISITAPGNSNRANVISDINHSEYAQDLAFSTLNSFKYILIDYTPILLFSPLLFLLLHTVYSRQGVKHEWNIKIHPIIFMLGLFSLIFAHYFVYFYATGIASPLLDRSSNINITFSVLSLYFLVEYSIDYYKLYSLKFLTIRKVLPYLIIVSFLLSNNMFIGLKSLRARDFIAYHDEMELRLKIVKESKGDTVIVPPIDFYPKWTYYSDINDDFANESNRTFSYYWGIKAIKIASPTDEKTSINKQ